MPKTKKEETPSGSDSDSGPDDRNPPPKKAKSDGGSTTKTDDKGGAYWELDRNRRVSVSEYRGKQYLNIREYYQNKTGDWCPGKGITLTQKEWTQLLALQPEIKFD